MSTPDLDEWDDVAEHGNLPRTIREALARELPRHWWIGALCGSADPDAWFPEALPIKAVVRTCQRCPLRRPCLIAALLGNEDGVWGGTTGLQRLKARGQLRHGRPVDLVVADTLAKVDRSTRKSTPSPVDDPTVGTAA